MEPEVVKVERRGRKRKRKDVQSAAVDQNSNKKAGFTRSMVLVGRYVKKEFEGSGVFLGKIVSYDTGLYRVDYEDGDCEDLESREVKLYLLGDGDIDDDLCKRKTKLDEYVAKKYTKDEVVPSLPVADKVVTVSSGNCAVENSVELVNVTDRVENSSYGGVSEVSGDHIEVDNESSSDLSDYEQCGDLGSEVETPSIPPPQLPPSSGNIGVSEEHVPYLLSVYSFLRSFSVSLFLSPFGLDDFVGALNSPAPNTLMDAIHVALMRALKGHVEVLSSEGSELASKCLRGMNWSLLDALTWPVFVVQYLLTMRYTEGPEWKDFYVNVLEKDYYTLSAVRKLIILQLLCDDALDSAELRAEVDMREESEVGSDPDGGNDFTDESGPRRVHPRYSKTSACKGQEAVKTISEGNAPRLSISEGSLTSKTTGLNVVADVDEDGNGDECRLCGMDGTLICCDGCPSAYHCRCIGVSKMSIPEGAWYCPECTINRVGPNVIKGTSLRGAELFGIDPYEQIFLGTCDHLLVMKASGSSEPCLRYYNPTDVQKVLSALNSPKEYRAMYLGICKNILQYWGIPDSMLFLTEPVGLEVVDGDYSTPYSLLAKESNNAQVAINAENVLRGDNEIKSEDVVVSCPDENCTETRDDNTSLDKVKEFDRLHQETVERASHGSNFKDSASVKVATTWSTASVSMQHFPSELTHQYFDGKLSSKEAATCASGSVNSRNRSHVDTICDVSSFHSKEATQPSRKRGYGSSADGYLYMGLYFKPQAYSNLYTQGDFAASAAASLAILSSEESRVSQTQPSSNHRKIMSANLSLQAKAFSLAAKRFCWPNSEKKLAEVPRERCGWCLSCKASVSSKRGCLLNAAASNAIKGTAKILASLRPSKNVEGSLASIATYVMFMEESLSGLTVGSFLSSTYRTQWRKQIEQASTLTAIKASLLEFEENIRSIAFSADWIKLVDDMSFDNPVNQTTSVVSTQKRGPGRRGRKPSIISEVADGDGEDVPTGFVWWRGGMLSKHIFQKGILPQSMIKIAARHGGSGKINGVHYAEGSEVPKRTRRFLWRAAVEMSKNASQLAIQVRYLDLYVRWNDLVRPEQPLNDGKGPETEASAFRNACIVDKKVVDGKLSYGVAFENQKHLPSRVLKNTLEVEEHGSGKQKYWFTETRIPLYLIKDYEKKVEKVTLPSSDKRINTLSSSQRKQLKSSGKNIFSFLSQKRDNLGKCHCSSCQLDVSFRNAAKCSVCQGYCHEQCAVSSSVHMKESLDFFMTCKQCYHIKTLATRNENMGDSPTSPLLLQGQESHHAMTIIKGGSQNGHRTLESLDLSSQKLPTTIHPTVAKSGKQNGCKRPSVSSGILDPSSEKKEATNRPSVTKGGKQNGHKRQVDTLDQSSGKKPAANDSSLRTKKSRSKLSLGLIWKKKNLEDTGINFRLKHILLKDNPNGHLISPKCYLCAMPYDSSLMYIRCEFCEKWYHADAVELEESKIFEVTGFKCCRCRRIRSPVCPYTDPETKKKLEAKKPHFRTQKQPNSGIDSNSEANDDDQVNDWELDTVPILDTKEEVVNVQEDERPVLPVPMVGQVNQLDTEVNVECSTGPVSGSVPQKLPVRRHIKPENESDGSSANNLAFEPSATYAGSKLNPTEESSTPILEWDVPMNGSEDDMMFDYGGLNYEDMEFEPQTYFSFKELLASDDTGQPDGLDPSGDVTGKWDNSSAPLGEDCNPEQYQMGITYDQQEPMFSVEAAVGIVSCRVCSQTVPCPDLSCGICGISIHSCCSPWDEQSSWEGSWKCGNCREWR